MRRALAGLVALGVAALVLAGCTATLEVEADIDRDGRGDVTLRLTMDAEAQEALGLAADAGPDEAAARFAPLLGDAGWSAGDGQISATRDGGTGQLVLETRHLVDSTDQLDDLMSLSRPIAPIAPDPSTLAALPDLPGEAPLLSAFDLRLGDGSGDNPGFDLFARGGLGEIGTETCSGDDVVGFARSLRDALEIRYTLSLPGGPGSTNADQTPRGDNVWLARYGDCPPLQASSGGGSSSTLVNGLILAGLAAFLLLVFALRAVRRRRAARPS